MTEKEKSLDTILENHKRICAIALTVIEEKGKEVAKFLRDKVSYKP